MNKIHNILNKQIQEFESTQNANQKKIGQQQEHIRGLENELRQFGEVNKSL